MRRWMGLAIGAMLAIALVGTFTPRVAYGYDFTSTEFANPTETVPYSDTGYLSANTNIVYEMSLMDDSNVILSLDFDSGVNFNFFLYDTNEDQIETSSWTPAGEEIVFDTTYAGTYYAVVECLSSSDSYTFTAAYAGYDFNSAPSLTIPGSISNQYLGTGEYDIYRVVVINSVATTFTLDGPAGSNFDLFLFDSAESEVWSSVNNGADESFTYSVSGTYYLVVDSISGSGSYTLTITTATGGSSNGYEKTTPPDSVIPWNSDSFAASGAYLDLADMIDEMKTNLTEEMPDELKVSFSGAGGIGQYILVEYAGEDGGNYKFDYSCRIYGALAVDGKMTADNVDMDGTTVDGTVSGKADVTGDLLYEGSLWLGYYENTGGKAYWAGEKMTLNIVASLDLSANMDADIKAEGMTMTGSMDASASVDMDIQITLESTPGIPFMPAKDEGISVERTCAVTYDGDVKFDMVMDMTATGYFDTMMGEDITIPDPVHFDNSASGSFEDTFGLDYNADTNKATAPPLLNGGWAFIENVDEIDLSGIGTRGDGFETTATYDASKGMYTTYDPYFGPADSMLENMEIPVVGDISTDTSSMDMTLEPVDRADAESFNEDPSAFLEDEGVGMPDSSSFPWLVVILAIVAVAVVVVLVLLMMMMKKKKAAKFNQHPTQYQGQQPYQQQPPQQGQYPQQQYPPQQPPQQPPQYPPQ